MLFRSGVYLDLPAKLFAQTMEAAAGKASLIKVVDPAPKQLPAPDSVQRALELLKGAKRPLILLGKGAAYAQADELLKQTPVWRRYHEDPGRYPNEEFLDALILAAAVRFAADTLNGVPSIVIGVFAYGVAVLPFRQFSAMAGGFALGIMMIPLIMRTTEELLRLVPGSLKEGALALGATRARTVTVLSGVTVPRPLR